MDGSNLGELANGASGKANPSVVTDIARRLCSAHTTIFAVGSGSRSFSIAKNAAAISAIPAACFASLNDDPNPSGVQGRRLLLVRTVVARLGILSYRRNSVHNSF